ncbi:NAD(P)/FAD-dependent oxidoreductase [bacterium]|jgi:predicted Rossmann fold flavoprotein|nr:NAD(P)/FAD-dependent oxidoreductase [bacterium]
MTTNSHQIIIVGGGAAGFFSAIHNKKNNPDSTVIIIEKSPEVLAKVKVSGGGRCNVTHACFDPKTLCDFYPRGHKELRGPFHSFQPRDTMQWFESHGVHLKIESDNRVFPTSNTSQSIIDCLMSTAADLGVNLWTDCQVTQITKSDDTFSVSLTNGQDHICQKLVLATGSSRRGHTFAINLGHTIETPIPSLFTFKVDDTDLHERTGLSVENTITYLSIDKKRKQIGPLLVTHWGMSGPGIIKLSAWHAKALHQTDYQAMLTVNWLANYDTESIQTRLQQTQDQSPKKLCISRSPFPEIPRRLWEYLVYRAGIAENQTWNNLSNKHTNKLIHELSQGQFQIDGKTTFKEEFVTCGGVTLSEINFKTMESKVCKGLHIIGELLDIDGVTGGFNFQNTWTTGYLSGQTATLPL